MPIVILVRHGENDYVKKGRLAGRLPGVHLNKNGREQAEAAAAYLAERLKEIPVKCVYTSPMERAVETAEPIAAALGVEIVRRPGLIETDCGEWQGMSVKGLSRRKIWRIVQNSPSTFTFPGGEAMFDTQYRIVTEIRQLIAAHEEKDLILCVSHADPIRLAVAYFAGIPLDSFQRLVVGPASISVLDIGPVGGKVLALNLSPGFAFPAPK